MRNLFCFHPKTPNTVGSVYLSLIWIIDLLNHCIDNPTSFKSLLIKPSEKIHPLKLHHLFIISNHSLYLRCCYLNALNHMPVGKSWNDVIKQCIEILSQCGITKYTNEKAIKRLHMLLHKELILPHPNTRVRSSKHLSPQIFHTYPEDEDKLSSWCS